MGKRIRNILGTAALLGVIGLIVYSCAQPYDPTGSDGGPPQSQAESSPCQEVDDNLDIAGKIYTVDPNSPSPSSVELVSDVNQPWSIAVDQDPNGYLYFVETQPGFCKGYVKRIKKDGTEPAETLASDLDRPSWVVLDDPDAPAYVYVTEYVASEVFSSPGEPDFTYETHDGTLRRITLSDGTVETLAEGLKKPLGIAVDGTHAYVAEDVPLSATASGKLKKVDLLDSDHPVTTLASSLNRPIGVQVDDTYVYIAEMGAGNVLRIRKDGSEPVPIILASGFRIPYPPVLDGADLYFADFDSSNSIPGKVYSLSGVNTPDPIANPPLLTLIGDSLNWPMLVAVDSMNLYFSEVWDSYIKSVPKAGGSSPTILAQDFTFGPQFMAVSTDGVFVYYSNLSGHGAISCCF